MPTSYAIACPILKGDTIVARAILSIWIHDYIRSVSPSVAFVPHYCPNPHDAEPRVGRCYALRITRDSTFDLAASGQSCSTSGRFDLDEGAVDHQAGNDRGPRRVGVGEAGCIDAVEGRVIFLVDQPDGATNDVFLASCQRE